ncbi:MAG: precorrin-6y C5,15-methyltransferase (decarboxylating) subunit CbiE [Prevotella sp.]|nr:precorrin-6y C5,15-methyltransferase (decarboxylating) subunit CbiE [Prevotella sp.]
MKTCDIIGISDSHRQWFPPEVTDIIGNGRIFSGGKRHHAIMAPLLPADAVWIDISVPLSAVFERYASYDHIVIFASGDPLFYGFANTVLRECKGVRVRVFPSFNSLQMLAHRLLMPYHDMRIVSLTGRPWPEFDRALIERAAKIGILTDREHTPAAIAQRMLDYGYTYYNMCVGEHLGNPMLERVTTLSLEEAAKRDFSQPNCIILNTNNDNSCFKERTFGIPDGEFALLDGREKMMTKMPIRLLTLQALDLRSRHVLWDIGSCTGSVSIEARLQFPHLRITAFEIRPECEAIIHENARRHGAPGIDVVMGDFLTVDCDSRTVDCDSVAVTSPPDAVFIGGHGGHLKAIMAKALRYLAPGGIIVMNSVKAPKVTTDSHRLWDEACRELGLRQAPAMRIVIDEHHPIEILKAYL